MHKVSMFFLVGSVVLIGLTAYLGFSLLIAKGKVRSTTATIVRIMNTAGKHRFSQEMATAGYTVNGEYYTSVNSIAVSGASKIGDKLQVRYFINKPERLLTKTFNQFIIFMCTTLVFVLSFICLYFYYTK